MKPLQTLLLAALLLAPALTHAQQSQQIDKRALNSLRRMSDSLAAAKAFTYTSESLVEVPAKTGQFITVSSDVKVALRRPDKLSAQLTGEAPNFNFYYNGATAAAFAPHTNIYSTQSAPPTIDAMLPALENETGIRLFSAPLLFSNPYAIFTKNLTSAIVVGPAMIDRALCEHLAFRSPGVNWEIWIQSGEPAVPRRIAVTFTDRPNSPSAIIEFTNWNLSPWLRNSQFDFTPPSGAKEIPFTQFRKNR